MAIIAAFAATAAHAQPPPRVDAEGRLTGTDGMVLYTYDPDPDNGSRCSGPCATAWPPYLAGPRARPHGGFAILARADHSVQWSYHGHPL